MADALSASQLVIFEGDSPVVCLDCALEFIIPSSRDKTNLVGIHFPPTS